MPRATSPSISPRVAITTATSYDSMEVRQQVVAALDLLGGIGDVVRPGDRVAIKVNLTGGVRHGPLPGILPTESYATHPEVVRALAECLRDAGASEILIVEAVCEWDSYRLWGFEEVAEAIGATLVDLNSPDPYDDFDTVLVHDGLVHDRFLAHRALQEVDVMVSVPKLKTHSTLGVTLSLKNAVGLLPLSAYRALPTDTNRSAVHGSGAESKTRLPRAVVDLNRAFPIHLALIDGIRSVEGGEGPWCKALAPVSPGLLIAGKDPVATDAIGTSVMGFDPQREFPEAPFTLADNHLILAGTAGLGTYHLREIEVVGASVPDVAHLFARPDSAS